MNVLAMTKELENPTEERLRNIWQAIFARCSGFVGQTRSILKYLEYKNKRKYPGEGGAGMSYVNKSLQKKDAMASGDRKASLHRRPGTKGLPDHQDLKESLCQCLGGRDQDGHSHEGRKEWH